MGTEGLRWQSGRQHRHVPRGTIAHAVLSLRLDFSLRATLVLRDGTGLRLPDDVLPREGALTSALESAGIAVERRPFARR